MTRSIDHMEVENERRHRIFDPATPFEEALELKRSIIKYEYPDDLQSWSCIRKFPAYVAQYSQRALYFVTPFDKPFLERIIARAEKRKFRYSIYQSGAFVAGKRGLRPYGVEIPPSARDLCHVYIQGGPVREILA